MNKQRSRFKINDLTCINSIARSANWLIRDAAARAPRPPGNPSGDKPEHTPKLLHSGIGAPSAIDTATASPRKTTRTGCRLGRSGDYSAHPHDFPRSVNHAADLIVDGCAVTLPAQTIENARVASRFADFDGSDRRR